MVLEIDVEDLMVDVVEDITIVLSSTNGFNSLGLPNTVKTIIETNAYASDRSDIGLSDTTDGSFIHRDSFEFYIPTQIYLEHKEAFRTGGFIHYNGNKYQINNPMLEFRGGSRTVLDCGFIGMTMDGDLEW